MVLNGGFPRFLSSQPWLLSFGASLNTKHDFPSQLLLQKAIKILGAAEIVAVPINFPCLEGLLRFISKG